MIVTAFEDRRKPTIQLDEEQAIAVRELDATAHLARQDDQLMSERGILCFKSALGLEERGDQVKEEEYQRDHPNAVDVLRAVAGH
jgi:hypothetical protein